jgi:hypothetical protein
MKKSSAAPGNVKDFPTKWADTQILTARQFLDAVV